MFCADLREVAGLSVHGQSDPDLWSSEPVPSQQEEDLQGSHGGGIRLSGGLLPGHEVNVQILNVVKHS